MNVFIYPNFEKNNAYQTTIKAIDQLLQIDLGVYMDTLYRSEIKKERVIFSEFDKVASIIDVIIVVGGDGTILKASKIIAKYDIALLGINTGKLGFMASLESDDLEKLKLLKIGDYTVNNRSMLKVTVHNKDSKNEYIALNDAVFSRMPSCDLPEFSIKINSAEVSKVRADGVIFSTPTGSTAYALSAGGPIIEPDISCIEVTQICAHSLFSRPMIFSSEKILSVITKTAGSEEVSLLVDGDAVASLGSDSIVTITSSDLVTKIIEFNDSAFYKAIDKKLMKSIK